MWWFFSFDVGQWGGSWSCFSRCPGWARCSDPVDDHHRRWRCTPSCWKSWWCRALACRCTLPTGCCCCQSGRCMQSPSRCCCHSCSWWIYSSQSCCYCCWWPLSQCTSCCQRSSRCCCSILLCQCCCQRRCCGTIFVSELLLNSSSLSLLFLMLSCLLFCLTLRTMLVLNSAISIFLMSGRVVCEVVAEILSISCCWTFSRDRRRRWCWFCLCFAGRWRHSRCWAPRCPFSCCQVVLCKTVVSIFLL